MFLRGVPALQSGNVPEKFPALQSGNIPEKFPAVQWVLVS